MPVIDIRPQEGAQTAFLSSKADFAIYGGSGGSGKSYGLLLEAARHINNPGYGAVIFRREQKMIVSECMLHSLGLFRSVQSSIGYESMR